MYPNPKAVPLLEARLSSVLPWAAWGKVGPASLLCPHKDTTCLHWEWEVERGGTPLWLPMLPKPSPGRVSCPCYCQLLSLQKEDAKYSIGKGSVASFFSRIKLLKGRIKKKKKKGNMKCPLFLHHTCSIGKSSQRFLSFPKFRLIEGKLPFLNIILLLQRVTVRKIVIYK